MASERPLETRSNVFDLDLQRRLRQDERIRIRSATASGRAFIPLPSLSESPHNGKYKKPRLLRRTQRESFMMMPTDRHYDGTRMISEVQRPPMPRRAKILDTIEANYAAIPLLEKIEETRLSVRKRLQPGKSTDDSNEFMRPAKCRIIQTNAGLKKNEAPDSPLFELENQAFVPTEDRNDNYSFSQTAYEETQEEGVNGALDSMRKTLDFETFHNY
jgi:hypothetical protein